MTYTLWDYVNEKGDNEIKAWATTLGPDKAKFENKLNMIRTSGFDLPPMLLSRTRSPHILKLRFFGRASIEWRPMLCRGPIDNDKEATVLLGAHEKGSSLVPPNADHDAELLRQKVIANPKLRRRAHERVT
jgi:hypothetical protein